MSGSQEVVTRRPRGDRQQDGGDNTPAVVIEQGDQISPEDALAEARQQLQAADQRTAEARRQARAAQQQAQQATQQAHDATTARVSDREVAVNSVLESAKAEIAAARASYRAAREAGDVDGEIAAQETLAGATARMHNATVEMERIKAAPKPTAQPQGQPQQQQVTPETQRWMDEHPAYQTDRRYQAMANATHFEAIEKGHAVESPGYFDYINNALSDVYGDNHGQTGGQQVQQQPRQRQQSARDTGDGLPPSRHSSGGNGGMKSLVTDLGEIQYRMGRDGSIESLKFPASTTMDNFKEGAQMTLRSLYESDPNKALVEYTKEFILESIEGGETIKHGDGRTLR